MKPEKKNDVKTELKDEELNDVSGGITIDDVIKDMVTTPPQEPDIDENDLPFFPKAQAKKKKYK